MGQAAIPLTLASTGLGVLGSLSQAGATASGYAYMEAKAQRQQKAALTAADQTDAFLREELNTTLGNISAIRAAAGTDPTSPTEAAIMANETRVSDRARRIKVGNLTSQAAQYGADADYFGYAGSMALDTGYLNAFSTGLKGLAGLGKTKDI